MLWICFVGRDRTTHAQSPPASSELIGEESDEQTLFPLGQQSAEAKFFSPSLEGEPLQSLPAATSENKQTSRFRLPDLKVQLSTPSDYLLGQRDDYAEVGHAAEFSEYGFLLSGEDLQSTEFRNIENTHAFAKPMYESYGLELSFTHQLLDQATEKIPFDVGQLELSYGLRYQQYFSGLYWIEFSGILGRAELDTNAINDLFGPHLALTWRRELLGFSFQFSSSYMAGLNYLEAAQTWSLGGALLPGALNRPAFAEPVSTSSGVSRSGNTSLTELGASVSYPVSEHLTLQLGYSSYYISDIHQAWNIQVWQLPNMGINPHRSDSLWDDQIHATLEWRR